MKKYLIGLLVIGLAVSSVSAQKVFDFNRTCQLAYNNILELKLVQGQQLLDKAKQQNPNNLIPVYLESYIDFLVLFFNEDALVYQQRKSAISSRIDLLHEGPISSPFYRYCLAQAHFHKAAIAIKFNENWSAGWAFRKSFQYIKENKKQHPDFVLNNLMDGSLQAVVSTIPEGYTFLAGILGMQGSLTQGMQQVKHFLSSNDAWAKLHHQEAVFMYTYLLFYIENKKDEALAFIKSESLDFVNHHLLTYMAVNLSLNNKQPDAARTLIANRNKSTDYLYTPVWEYEAGIACLFHLELEEAIGHFEKFVKEFKGSFYMKDALLKLSWCYYLKGNIAAATAVREQIRTRGVATSDADKQALKDVQNNYWPNVVLLKARMLNDGGYDQEALKVLAGTSASSFAKEEEKLEYTYRVARIYDDLKQYDKAIKTYEIAIALGTGKPAYYAARAALQTGNILEKQGKKQLAIVYYEKCLQMKGHEYKNSLDQKAKSGIARCKGM